MLTPIPSSASTDLAARAAAQDHAPRGRDVLGSAARIHERLRARRAA